ncbi:hypothetical protein R3P38DRAFT_2541235 [Favolaschia claudopus]|uniref:Protein kinase domain-containing protein n=1 Tax=Favolaschia claudopus TaxID=2862362 RepID=A0AAW0AW13_9AGAR
MSTLLSRTGSMFSGSSHFTVVGGTFNNVTKSYNSTPIPDSIFPYNVRSILVGDINLGREVCINDGSGVVELRRGRRGARRLYSAKIGGQDMVVAMYHGNDAEKNWRRDIALYMTIRHPNIIQIYGAARSPADVHITAFHDHLIPLQRFLNFHRQSPMRRVYTYTAMLCAVQTFFYSTFHYHLDGEDCTMLIRQPTGQLCIDLFPSDISMGIYGSVDTINRPDKMPLLGTPDERSTIVEALTLVQYHDICNCHLGTRLGSERIFSAGPVNLGAVMSLTLWEEQIDSMWEEQVVESTEIATLPNSELDFGGCSWHVNGLWAGEIMNNGWTRFSSGEAAGTTISRGAWMLEQQRTNWLSQANYIFSRLGIESNFDQYFLVDHVLFEVKISANVSTCPPKGFLFLCPWQDFRSQSGSSSLSSSWPEYPIFWSLDPLGRQRLNAKQASKLGFPSLQFYSLFGAQSWDESVYVGLDQFHQAKGFNPKSQDAAMYLGHPLYQFPFKQEARLAHGELPYSLKTIDVELGVNQAINNKCPRHEEDDGKQTQLLENQTREIH